VAGGGLACYRSLRSRRSRWHHFQSHHRGIRTDTTAGSHCRYTLFQSHHRGIRTWSNRTSIQHMPKPFNRTIEVLEPSSIVSICMDRYSFNRTIEVLELWEVNHTASARPPFNRTIEVLEHSPIRITMSHVIRHFQSHHRGIRTRRLPGPYTASPYLSIAP